MIKKNSIFAPQNMILFQLYKHWLIQDINIEYRITKTVLLFTLVVCLHIKWKRSCSQKYYYVRRMIYRYCEKDTRNGSKMILANVNGKTLVQNIRNKANKAARKTLLRIYIFFLFPSHFLSNLITIMDIGVMKKVSARNITLTSELHIIVELFIIIKLISFI